MSEKQMWETIRPHMAHLDPQRIENSCGTGCPDTEFVGGWMELKEMPPYRRKRDIWRVDHYTQEQRVWAIKRARAGGRVWMLLKAGDVWMLFDGVVAAQTVGKYSYEDTVNKALRVWNKNVDWEEFVACLTR